MTSISKKAGRGPGAVAARKNKPEVSGQKSAVSTETPGAQPGATLGQRLKWLIRTLAINQVAFAKAADVKDSTVCSWVKDNRMPHKSNLRRAIVHFDLPAPDVMRFLYDGGDESFQTRIEESIRFRDLQKEVPSGRLSDLLARDMIVYAAGYIEDRQVIRKITEFFQQKVQGQAE